jgi:hypothetical protein
LREKVKRLRVGVIEERLRDGQVIAQGFSAGGRGDHDDVFAGSNVLDRFDLMGVEALDAEFGEVVGERLRRRCLQHTTTRRAGRDNFHVNDLVTVIAPALQVVQEFGKIHAVYSVRPSSCPQDAKES